jgi:hypothetical protein
VRCRTADLAGVTHMMAGRCVHHRVFGIGSAAKRARCFASPDRLNTSGLPGNFPSAVCFRRRISHRSAELFGESPLMQRVGDGNIERKKGPFSVTVPGRILC